MHQYNTIKQLLPLAAVVVFIGHSHAQFSTKARTDLSIGSGNLQTRNPLRGNGLCFTPNKGQLTDTDGKLRPDVLYKGDGAGADIYLRKTGISYVYTNMTEVMHEVDEQIEDLIKAGTITEAYEKEKKDELLEMESIKLHRVDMDFAGCNSNISAVNEDEVDGYQNFYYAHCPQGISKVKQYNKITCKNIYNNIDVIYYACPEQSRRGNKDHGLKYDLIVQPHADPIKYNLSGRELKVYISMVKET
ncbi:MAG: hypothetical protein HYU69_06360 [Bacteroidetes bacterium]|nr:hypothetical protein [Bacteroidota bacterium]